MKLKPIEPGCKAIIISDDGAKNRGKQVVVELLIPTDGIFSAGGLSYTNHGAKAGKRMWKVVGDTLEVLIDETFQKQPWSTVEEKSLMRIDGGDFENEDNPYAIKDRSHV